MAGFTLPGFGGGRDLSGELRQGFRDIVPYNVRLAGRNLIAGPNKLLGLLSQASPAQSILPTLDYNYQPPVYGQDAGGSAGPSTTQASDPLLTDLASSDTSGGGTSAAYTPDIRVFNNQTYDITDPNQRAAYVQARQIYAQSEADRSINALKEAIALANSREGQDLATSLSGINQDLTNLGQEQVDYGQQVVRSIGDLGRGYDTGTVNRQNFFGGLSPNAYQSSQGSSQQFAKGKLDQGIADINQAKTRTEEAYRQRGSAIEGERTALQTAFERAQQDRANQLQQASQAAQDYVNNFGDSTAESLAPLDFSQGITPNSYARQTYNPVEQFNADLSGVTPFTTFNQIGSLPQATSLQTYKTSTPAQGNGLESFLGYTPSTEEADFLRRYLQVGA